MGKQSWRGRGCKDGKWKNKDVKRCLSSLIIREEQIKATMKYHYTTLRMATKKSSNTKYCWGWNGIIHTLLVGMWNDLVTLGNSMTVSYKTKYALSILPSNYLLSVYPRRNENSCSHKDLYSDVHSSFIPNSQKLETTQMSLNRWMVKQTVIHPYHRIRFCNIKNWIINADINLDTSQRNCAE